MIDTDFEKDSRAHSFWEEWQSAADGVSPKDVDPDAFVNLFRVREPEPDNTPRREGDEMSDYIASINPDWAFVVEK